MVWPFNRRSAPAPERKENPVGGAYFLGGVPQWSPPERHKYVTEGFQQNVIIYRAIREIAEAAKGIEIELHRRGTIFETHPALDLLSRPNPRQSWEQFLAEIVTNRMLFGEVFITADSEGKPVELWSLSPLEVSVVPGTKGLPAAYVHERNGKKRRFEVDQMNGTSQAMCLKTYNPGDYWRGQAPMQAAALASDTHNAGMKWNWSLLENGARPSLIVRFMGAYPGAETLARMDEHFKRNMAGKYNAGSIPILAEGADVVETSKTPMDMDFMNTMREAAKLVSSAFGVPLPLIDNDASTFNNLEQAKERLYTDTVIPLLSEIMAALGDWLLPRYGDGLEFRLNLDSIPALEGIRQRMFERALAAYETGVLTLEESRAMIGYPEQPEGMLRPLPGMAAEQKAEGYKPTDGMREEAARGLEWRREFNRGGTEVGVARARDIVNGRNLSADTVKRMHSFFSRHEVDKQGEGFNKGEPGYPSAGRIAWALWGGDAGQAWARDKVAAMDGGKATSAAELLYRVAYGDGV